VFTARYALSPYIKQIRFVFKGLTGSRICEYGTYLLLLLFSADTNGYSYANALLVLNLRTLHDRRHQLDALFVIHIFLGPKSCPSNMVFHFPLGTFETLLCFVLVHVIKTAPPPGAPLRQIQFVIIWMSSERKLSHLDVMLLYYIIIRRPN
jgi:hypothetical protein